MVRVNDFLYSDISVDDFTTFMENLDKDRKVIESEEKTNNNSNKELWSVVLGKKPRRLGKTQRITEMYMDLAKRLA